jgi:hypothetical protein
MINTTTWAKVVMAALIGAAVVACGSTATPSPRLLGQDPVGLPGGGSTHDFADSFQPGTPFGWSVFIQNTADQPAVVDGYQLLDKSAALEVVGAAAIPSAPEGLGIGKLMFVNDDLRSAVAARPLVGSSIGAPNTVGWTDGGSLFFLLQAPSAGDYSLSAVRLRYHVGSQTFETDIPASLEVCAGATVPPGSACPFPSSSPSR